MSIDPILFFGLKTKLPKPKADIHNSACANRILKSELHETAPGYCEEEKLLL